MSDLPIESIRTEIITGLRETGRVVLTAPTGAGKSTQVPQMLLDEHPDLDGQIIVLQPRRLAARMLAKRVASERRVRLGMEVGFQVRFQEMANPDTRILYMTEGLFWRRLIQDPTLKGIGAVLFDEFHERHVDGDLALSRTVDIQKNQRPDLIIGVMSATLEVELATKFLAPCTVLRCEGRSYPVEILYSGDGSGEGSRPVWERVAKSLPEILRNHPEGNALIFMPGAFEIRKTIEAIQNLKATRGIEVFSLHGEMPPEKQDQVLASGNKRKIIVSTNVAETSLTIDGVRIVIDSGLAKISRYDPKRGVNGLMTERISRASADQRAGRAGRVAPGVCLRLWKETDTAGMMPHTDPEVYRVDLAPGMLEMLAGGVGRASDFAWIESPSPEAISSAEKLLVDLGAICEIGGHITPEGKRMATFPLHPRYAKMLLEGEKRGCLGLVIQLAALVQGRPFLLPLKENKKERERQQLLMVDEMPGSDFFYLYRAFGKAAENGFSRDFCQQWGIHGLAAREAWQVAQQYLNLAKSQKMDFGESESMVDLKEVRKCLLAAFPEQVARRLDRGTLRCALPGGRRGELRRSSIADNTSLVVVAEIDEVKKGSSGRELLLGLATEIEEAWLEELFPGSFSSGVETVYDSDSRRVVVREVRKFGDLIIEEKSGGNADETKAAELLAGELQAGRITLKKWDQEVEQWIERVNFLSTHCPDYEVAIIDEEAKGMLLQEICLGSMSYREVKNKEILPVLKSWLASGMEPILDSEVPEYLEIPGRKKPVRLRYDNGEATLSLTVQELMKVKKHPTLASGTHPVLIEILAPNRRPVQITRDLTGFWLDSYPQIRKDLRGRYPKHDWPESVEF